MERAPLEQTPKPPQSFHSLSTLSAFVAGGGKRAGGLYPVSASKEGKTMLRSTKNIKRFLVAAQVAIHDRQAFILLSFNSQV